VWVRTGLAARSRLPARRSACPLDPALEWPPTGPPPTPPRPGMAPDRSPTCIGCGLLTVGPHGARGESSRKPDQGLLFPAFKKLTGAARPPFLDC